MRSQRRTVMERGSRRSAWRPVRRRRLSALLIPATVLLLVVGCSSSNKGGSGTSSKGCGAASSAPDAPANADFGFYCGKTITFIVDDGPGSDNDREMQALKA